MRVEFSRFVPTDLEAIGDYIARDNPRRAVTFIDEIQNKVRSIGKAPQHYQLRPEIGDEARLATVGQYVILFRVIGRTVRIERIIFGGRDLVDLFDTLSEPKP